MKKFRFLIFMLMLTSIFIGCAQPTDDTVIPEASDEQPTLESDVEKALNGESSFKYNSLGYYKISLTKSFRPFYLDATYEFTDDDEKAIVTVTERSITSVSTDSKLDVQDVIGILKKLNGNFLTITPEVK